jgi:glucose/arabinose dehydrogenase
MKTYASALLVLIAACHSSSSSNGTAPLPGADGSTPGPVPGVDASPPLPEKCMGNAYSGAYLADPKLCLALYAQDLAGARQLAFAPNGDLFVSAGGQLKVLHDTNGDLTIDDGEAETFTTAAGNHAVVFAPDGRYVYASSDSAVYRWAYASGDRKASGAAEVVIKNLPPGGHSTRTLLFDGQGRLYVSIGSAENVDKEPSWPTRAMIRRYSLASVPAGGIDSSTGEVFASGLRNEVGLHLDSKGRFWGVENGRDNLTDPALGNITNDNPAEELNRFDVNAPGKFYGYPFCWSEGIVDAGARGKGAAWPDLTNEVDPAKRKSAEYCRDAASVVPPAFAMPAHWAPLGVIEYTGGVLPWRGDLIIAAHGSWNRNPQTGRVIARAHLNADGSVASVDPMVGESDGAGGLRQGTWDARPVDVRQGPDEALYVSDDNGGRVFRLSYRR